MRVGVCEHGGRSQRVVRQSVACIHKRDRDGTTSLLCKVGAFFLVLSNLSLLCKHKVWGYADFTFVTNKCFQSQ